MKEWNILSTEQSYTSQEKEWLRVNSISSYTHGMIKAMKLQMKMMCWIMIDFEEHAQTAYGAMVPQVSIKIRN